MSVEYSDNARFEANGQPPTSEWDGVTQVRYTSEPDPAQVSWGGNSNPAEAALEVGRVYEVERIVVHSWHTKVFLADVECGRGFNSVSFEAVAA